MIIEKKILALGFKKVWLDDKSGYWFELPFKIGFIKGKFCADLPNFFYISIITKDKEQNKDEKIFWDGSYRRWREKVDNYINGYASLHIKKK